MDPFTLYSSSAAASYLGDGVRFAALPMLAASLSSSPGDVAIVSAALTLPWLMFGLLSGVIVDRVRRARLMALLQIVRGVVGAAIVLGVAAESLTIPSLAVLVALLGTCEVFYDVASHALLPTIVDHARLHWANGRLVTTEVIAFEFVGPFLGGAMFAAAAVLPFVVDAGSFVLSAVLLSRIARTQRSTQPQRGAASSARSIAEELREGLRWFRDHPLVRSLSLLAAAANLGAGGFYAVLVLFAQQDLSLGPRGYGALVAVSAVGSVSAAVVADRLASGNARRLVALGVAPGVAACFGVIAAYPRTAVAAVAMIAFGFIVSLFNIVAVSLRQLVTPGELLGRVTSVHRCLCWGALPLGAAMAGIVGNQLSVRTAIMTCAFAVALVGLMTVRPVLRTPASAYAPELAAA